MVCSSHPRFSPILFLLTLFTSCRYRAVLRRLDDTVSVLDVGIGTATALAANSELVVAKKLRLVGVDYEKAYIKRAGTVLKEHGLQNQVKVVHASVYDKTLGELVGGGLFDIVYFSGSISLMPDPPCALTQSAKLLKAGGLIYVTQTFYNRNVFTKVLGPALAVVKPLMFYVTTIDFGKATYEDHVLEYVRKAKMEVVENKPIPGDINTIFQTARLLILRPGRAD